MLVIFKVAAYDVNFSPNIFDCIVKIAQNDFFRTLTTYDIIDCICILTVQRDQQIPHKN